MNTLQNPPLVVRLLADLGKLPAGIAIEFPRETALLLIMKRMATPVGSLDISPDLIVSEDDLPHLSLGADYWRDQQIAA